MLLEIPEELITKQVAKEVVSITLREIDKRMSLITKTTELPPYATQNELMEVLGVGHKKIKYWLSIGLVCQDWSKEGADQAQLRFEREKVQEFLRDLEVTADI